MRLNDAHCHFFSRRFFETLARDDRRGRFADSPVEDICATLEWEAPGSPSELAATWISALDHHGVSRAALIASVPGDEVSVTEAVRHAPDRFVGFFMVNPLAEDAVDRVSQAIANGLRTVCLFPAMHRYALSDAKVAAVIAAAAAGKGAALFVHCGVLTVGIRKKLGLPSRFDMRFGNPVDLHGLALEHPQLPIIVPHFGAGFFREALMAADLCPNIHLDTSSSNSWVRFVPGLTLTEVFRRALAVAGPDRLIFGSDSSYFPRGWRRVIYGAQRTILDEIGAEPDTVAKIFGGNFDRVFAS
jgi:predicted TIM-barrel fold metal-dependent hydrolase